jgi:O-antigen biosynthesis protein
MNRVPGALRPDLVSVVVPCYNAEPFVAEAIESVLGQSFPAVELVVVDDASTDGSLAVLERYRERLTVLRLATNGGASRARNHGAGSASGEYLMFLDADDVIGPHTLAGLVEALRGQAGDIAGCRWQRLKELDGRWQAVPAEIPLPDPEGDPLRGWLGARSWLPPCAILWRRDTFARVGGWDEELTLNDDGDLMMRALVAGARLVMADRGEAFYRWHGSERVTVSTDVFSDRKLGSQRRVLEKLESMLRARGMLADYGDALGAGYQYLALLALSQGHPELGLECQQRGEEFAGRRPMDRTGPGRLLTRLLGVERKERIAGLLARLGIASRERRRFARLAARRSAVVADD